MNDLHSFINYCPISHLPIKHPFRSPEWKWPKNIDIDWVNNNKGKNKASNQNNRSKVKGEATEHLLLLYSLIKSLFFWSSKASASSSTSSSWLWSQGRRRVGGWGGGHCGGFGVSPVLRGLCSLAGLSCYLLKPQHLEIRGGEFPKALTSVPSGFISFLTYSVIDWFV